MRCSELGVRVEPPGRPDGQHEVVARPVAERPEDRVAHAAALVDEEHLVGHAVAVERALGHRAGRTDDAEHHVVVEVQRQPAGHHVAGDGQPSGLGQAVAMEAVVGGLEPDARTASMRWVLRRWRQVVEQRRSTGEALHPEQLLGVERAVGRAVLGVALAAGCCRGRRSTSSDWPPRRCVTASLGPAASPTAAGCCGSPGTGCRGRTAP